MRWKKLPTPVCPNCKQYALTKAMEKAVKLEGVWFPGYKCKKCSVIFSYEEIWGKEKLERELDKIRYMNAASKEFFEDIAGRVIIKRLKELERRATEIERRLSEK